MQLIWSAPARHDLLDIAFHYGQIDSDLPFTLLERIYDAPIILTRFPNIGSPTSDSRVRKWVVKRTPFILFYVINGNRIEIRHVRHASSNWQNEI
jgi:plasmid stabilization system protein ParE